MKWIIKFDDNDNVVAITDNNGVTRTVNDGDDFGYMVAQIVQRCNGVFLSFFS